MSLVWKLKYEHVYKISAKKMFGDTPRSNQEYVYSGHKSVF
jgi:hypothetical protein